MLFHATLRFNSRDLDSEIESRRQKRRFAEGSKKSSVKYQRGTDRGTNQELRAVSMMTYEETGTQISKNLILFSLNRPLDRDAAKLNTNSGYVVGGKICMGTLWGKEIPLRSKG